MNERIDVAEDKLELENTAPGMLSDDYKRRFVAEYTQLAIREKRLRRYLAKLRANKLKHEMICHEYSCSNDEYAGRTVLEQQHDAMVLYMSSMEVRAVLEGIEL